MATDNIITIQIIDNAVAKRLFQRRTLLSYVIEPQRSTTEHVVFFDTPTRALHAAHHALSIVVHTKEHQIMRWHRIVDQHTLELIASYDVHGREWPVDVVTWLTNNHIPTHHLLPNAHVISKSHPRLITDHLGNTLVRVEMTQGIISTTGTHESWESMVLEPSADHRSHEIDGILEHIYQHIPHRIDKRHLWHRINTNLATSTNPLTLNDILVRQSNALIGIQRSADEALFIPLPAFDDETQRRTVATIMRLHQDGQRAFEPFLLSLEDDTFQLLTTLAAQITKPSYAVSSPALDATQFAFSEVLRLRLRIRFRSLLEREAEVLNGFSAYDVQRIRVNLRKMRALLECGEGIFEGETLTQFRRGFRRMARFLGEIRDCDAFEEHVLRILEVTQLPAPFTRGLSVIRRKALQNFQALLTDNKHQLFLQQFATFVTTPHSATILQIQPLPLVLSQRIKHQQRDLSKPHPKSLVKMNDDALHDLRIQAKHLRYLLESFADLLLPAGEFALGRLIAVQDHLGTIQDAAVAQQLLTQMHLVQSVEGKRILQTLRQEAHKQRLSLPDIWATCQDDEFSASIQRALTTLDQP
jgi:CHAD domain-containing protein